MDQTIFQRGYRGVVSVAASKQEAGGYLQEIIAVAKVNPVEMLQGMRDLSALSSDTSGVVLDTDAITAGNILRVLPNHLTDRYGLVDAGSRQRLWNYP